jgi:hypothetical protein
VSLNSSSGVPLKHDATFGRLRAEPDDTEKPLPPEHLSAEMRSWWSEMVEQHDIDEPHRLLILTAAADAWDQSERARQILAEQGLLQGDGKAHPAALIQHRSRNAFACLVSQLGL